MLTDTISAPLILIVEDDCNHADLIQRSFEDAPEEYHLEFADSISTAKNWLKLHLPELILTDFRLPDGYGSDLITAVNRHCPVIIMTSHGNEQIAVETMKIGANDYIVKSPEVFEKLPTTVKYSLVSWELKTARRQAIDTDLRAKSDWERTFDAVPDLISIIDLNHTITRVNRAMADCCGVPPQELIGRKCYEVMHGMSHLHPGCPHADLIRDGREHSKLIEEKRWNKIFDITVSPLHNSDGQLTASVHVARDVTSRKRAEKALQESEERHRKLANEQKIILNTSSVGITLIKDRVVLWANPAFDRMFGYEEGSTCGVNTEVFYPDYEQYTSFGNDAYSTIINDVIFSQDIRMKKKDGSLFWCNLVGQVVTPGNLNDGSIWIFHDISDRKRTEEANSHLEAQLHQAQKMESVGRLAGGVAHDFNNLLTVILGNTYLSLMDLDPEQPLHAYISSIKTAAEKSADLTQQLLTFARKQTVTPKVLDLNAVVAGMLKMLQRLIGEDINLNWHPAANLWLIKTDPTQIDQILANLCVNARDSIKDIGKITIATENCILSEPYCAQQTAPVPEQGEFVKLTVSDDGCGMDKETVAKIFEPFFTTKELGKGTGLGLATVYGIVKQNNGFIEVYSEPEQGTTFAIFLPRYDDDTRLQTETAAITEPLVQGRETILLVEDEIAILKITATMLTKLGYRVLQASTPAEAIALVETLGDQIQLLITDMVMPEMNGLDLSRRLVSLYPKLKCLFMSGYTADVISRYDMSDEGLNFINKPFSLPDLAAHVREALND